MNEHTMRTVSKLGLLAALLVVLAVAPAAAEPMELGTADGVPPSIETVCDGQAGAAFGLCNAYCEAMDCDIADAQASQQACDKVRDKFVNLTGVEIPCELDCPCVDSDELWAEVVANPELITGCDGVTALDNFVGVILFTSLPEGSGPFEQPWPVAWDGQTFIGAFPVNTCGKWLDRLVDPLSAAEAQACQQVLRNLAASQNVECPVDPR